MTNLEEQFEREVQFREENDIEDITPLCESGEFADAIQTMLEVLFCNPSIENIKVNRFGVFFNDEQIIQVENFYEKKGGE